MNLESNQENSASKCDEIRLELDEYMEALVDRRRQPDAEGKPSLAISGRAQEHINNCDECLNYKLENSALIEAAAELPAPQDEQLTLSIMQSLEADFAALGASAKSQIESTAKETATRLSPPLAMALSFIGLTALLCLDDGMVDWSIVSWCIALLVVLSFKPLLEKQQNRYPYAGA